MDVSTRRIRTRYSTQLAFVMGRVLEQSLGLATRHIGVGGIQAELKLLLNFDPVAGHDPSLVDKCTHETPRGQTYTLLDPPLRLLCKKVGSRIVRGRRRVSGPKIERVRQSRVPHALRVICRGWIL